MTDDVKDASKITDAVQKWHAAPLEESADTTDPGSNYEPGGEYIKL